MQKVATKPIDQWTDELLERAISGAATIYRLGQPVSYRLTAAQREAFEQAKERGFLLNRSYKPGCALHRAFYTWCEVHSRPFVAVRLKGSYSHVEMDTLTRCNAVLTEEQQEEVRELLTSSSQQGADIHAGASWPSTNRVSNNRAEAVAIALYQLGCLAMPRSRQG